MSRRKPEQPAAPELLQDCRGGCGLRVPPLVAVCRTCREACPEDLRLWYEASRQSAWPYARWAAEDAMRRYLRDNPPVPAGPDVARVPVGAVR